MQSTLKSFLAAALGLSIAGCVEDRSPPPPRIAVPPDASEGMVRQTDPVKPLPGEDRYDDFAPPPESGPPPGRPETPRPPPRQDVPNYDAAVPAPPYDDPALIDQELPERRPFVEAYRAVGRPALLIEGVNQSQIFSGPDRPAALVFSDWMRCDGEVMILTTRNDSRRADVIIEFVSEGSPTNDDGRGALNLSVRATDGADSALLGQAMIDMPVPADRAAVNRYTRFLARKLMSDMTRSWTATMGPADRPGNSPSRPNPDPNPDPLAPERSTTRPS